MKERRNEGTKERRNKERRNDGGKVRCRFYLIISHTAHSTQHTAHCTRIHILHILNILHTLHTLYTPYTHMHPTHTHIPHRIKLCRVDGRAGVVTGEIPRLLLLDPRAPRVPIMHDIGGRKGVFRIRIYGLMGVKTCFVEVC